MGTSCTWSGKAEAPAECPAGASSFTAPSATVRLDAKEVTHAGQRHDDHDHRVVAVAAEDVDGADGFGGYHTLYEALGLALYMGHDDLHQVALVGAFGVDALSPSHRAQLGQRHLLQLGLGEGDQTALGLFGFGLGSYGLRCCL